MNDAVLLERMLANMRAWLRALARAAPESRLLELDGVLASVVPATPDRSVPNSVLYEESAALGAALDELALAYETAGVRAWTVWVPEADRAAADLLERAGHRLDATPLAMARELGGVQAGAAEGTDWTSDGDVATLAALNDAAYPFPDRPFSRFLAAWPADEATRIYVARSGGRQSSSLMAYDHAGDCGIYFVATRPDARGRGLASELMRQAGFEARERGCDTTSLQATRMGAPVYARAGYRALGALQMWERRER